MSKHVLAWHFTGSTLRDNQPIPKKGMWLVHKGHVKICQRGLHASRRIIDALQYAPGSAIHRVECEGIEEEHPDKFVCRGRKILWSLSEAEGEQILRDFARYAARTVLHLWDAPDIVRRYLRTGDAKLRDAAWAAWDAAGVASGATAWAAVYARLAGVNAARAATKADAWDATLSAVYARLAAGRDARAARDRQNRHLTGLVMKSHKALKGEE